METIIPKKQLYALPILGFTKISGVLFGHRNRLVQACQCAWGSADKRCHKSAWSGFALTRRASGRIARCESTPATSQCHLCPRGYCASVTWKTVSPAVGQTKPPRCKRRWHSQTPSPKAPTIDAVPQQQLQAVARPVAEHERGACARRLPQRLLDDGRQAVGVLAHLCPAGMSTGDTANQMCGGHGISPGIATAPPTTPPICPTAVQACGRPRAAGSRAWIPALGLVPE